MKYHMTSAPLPMMMTIPFALLLLLMFLSCSKAKIHRFFRKVLLCVVCVCVCAYSVSCSQLNSPCACICETDTRTQSHTRIPTSTKTHTCPIRESMYWARNTHHMGNVRCAITYWLRTTAYGTPRIAYMCRFYAKIICSLGRIDRTLSPLSQQANDSVINYSFAQLSTWNIEIYCSMLIAVFRLTIGFFGCQTNTYFIYYSSWIHSIALSIRKYTSLRMGLLLSIVFLPFDAMRTGVPSLLFEITFQIILNGKENWMLLPSAFL